MTLTYEACFFGRGGGGTSGGALYDTDVAPQSTEGGGSCFLLVDKFCGEIPLLSDIYKRNKLYEVLHCRNHQALSSLASKDMVVTWNRLVTLVEGYCADFSIF